MNIINNNKFEKLKIVIAIHRNDMSGEINAF